jgi:hypothetical protein
VRAWRVEWLVRGRDDLAWAANLSRMCQVALVGYLVGGAFLGLAYFDLPYTIMAIVIATGAVAQKQLASGVNETGRGWRAAVGPPASVATVQPVGSR